MEGLHMSRRKLIWSAWLLAAGITTAVSQTPAQAQARRGVPERKLMGISLGADQLDVIRNPRFGRPSKVQTVALATPAEQLPSLGGGAGGEGGGYPGMGGMGGGYPGAMGGGYPGMGGGAFGGP